MNTSEHVVDTATDEPVSHHYGGDHHRLSLIDRLGERVEAQRARRPAGHDPASIARMVPILDSALAYFDPEIHGFEGVCSRDRC